MSEPLTIEQIITALKSCKPHAHVNFDFAGCFPTRVGCYRGYYECPAIGWSASGYSVGADHFSHEKCTVAAVIAELESATDGREYTAWKGEEYSFKPTQVLYVDNPGDYNGTVIVGVNSGDRDWKVVLETAAVP
jgi:hypothetical protein